MIDYAADLAIELGVPASQSWSQCHTCNHPQRAEIEAAVRAGLPVFGLARKYQIAHTSIRGHRDKHMPMTTPQGTAAATNARVRRFEAVIDQTLDEAELVLRAKAPGKLLTEEASDKLDRLIARCTPAMRLVAVINGDKKSHVATLAKAEHALKAQAEANGLADEEVARRAHAYLESWNEAHPDKPLYLSAPATGRARKPQDRVIDTDALVSGADPIIDPGALAAP